MTKQKYFKIEFFSTYENLAQAVVDELNLILRSHDQTAIKGDDDRDVLIKDITYNPEDYLSAELMVKIQKLNIKD